MMPASGLLEVALLMLVRRMAAIENIKRVVD